MHSSRPRPTTQHKSPARRVRRALIVDDDSDFTDGLAQLVREYGLKASIARATQDAIQVLGHEEFDFVLIGVRLGSEGGIGVLGTIRHSHPGLICIVIAGHSSADTAVAALHQGAYAYLHKPFHPNELLAILRQACECLDLAEGKQRAESALRRYVQIASSTADLMAFVDHRCVYREVNDALSRSLGCRRSQLVGAALTAEGTARHFGQRLEPSFRECLDGQAVHFKDWIELPALGRRFMDVAIHPVRSERVDEAGAVLSLRDLTDHHRLSEQLHHQARHDELTGLPNRREFENRLRMLIDNAHTAHSHHALCYLDLDQFKIVNDTCGHVAGDELLRRLGAVLPQAVRKDDLLARLGGDEFGVLMAGCDLEQATRVGDKLLEAVRGFRFEWNDSTFTLAASIGAVLITKASEGIEHVMSLADQACYAAKDAGRNRLHVYHDNDAGLVRRHGEMQWVTKMHRALDEDRFRLDLQPISPVQRDGTQAEWYEALVRMVDLDGAVIEPAAFQIAAERFDVAAELDLWVCGHAIELLQCTEQPRIGLLSINLSAQSLGNEKLRNFLLDAFTNREVDASKLCFEITETAAIANLASAMRFISELREFGCRFALDDFGSGLSSFAYLKNLPVDILKIDGMFVRDMVDDPIDRAMVRSINEVGHVMGMKTVGECVETIEIWKGLQEMGIDYAQGYFIGRPQASMNARPT